MRVWHHSQNFNTRSLWIFYLWSSQPILEFRPIWNFITRTLLSNITPPPLSFGYCFCFHIFLWYKALKVLSEYVIMYSVASGNMAFVLIRKILFWITHGLVAQKIGEHDASSILWSLCCILVCRIPTEPLIFLLKMLVQNVIT